MMNKDPAMGVSQYERNELDFYETPEWCSEIISDRLIQYIDYKNSEIWEPACGLGAISEVLSKYWIVHSTDIVNRGYSSQVDTKDFLDYNTTTNKPNFNYNAIVTNPPYGKLLDKFIYKALELTKPQKGLVAMLMRNEVDCASSRQDIFYRHGAFAEKVVLLKRPRWIEYKKGDAGPRHNYAWYIWDWKRLSAYPIITYAR